MVAAMRLNAFSVALALVAPVAAAAEPLVGDAPLVWLAGVPLGIYTIIAAFLGFLGGTVINHWLIRRRDDRLRDRERRALAAALRGELLAARARVSDTPAWVAARRVDLAGADESATLTTVGTAAVAFGRPIFEARAADLGLLPAGLAAEVSVVYGELEVWVNHSEINGLTVTFVDRRLVDMTQRFGPLMERIDRLMAVLYDLAVHGKKPPPDWPGAENTPTSSPQASQPGRGVRENSSSAAPS